LSFAGILAVATSITLSGGCGAPLSPPGFSDDGGGSSNGSSGSSGSGGSSGASGSGSSSGELPGDASMFTGSSSGSEAGLLSDASLANDGTPTIDGTTCTSGGDAGAPPYPQRCVAMTDNECDGRTDQALQALGVPASLLNGTGGNGFDDDCDGQVDEGCGCNANGLTKPCYLVPATQVDPSTKEPVGWCTVNSKGTVDCAGVEFPKWSGVCRGAQPPYPDDVCAPGDFNCDGLPENPSTVSCACQTTEVTCPMTPLVEQPYPDPTNIPLIDGSQWIVNAADRPNTMNWTWTVIGGDCDNVLPHPTFAMYNVQDSTVMGARRGKRTPVQYSATATPPRYVATPGQPLISIQAVNYSNGIAGAQVHPAFGLSGDYLVQGEWDLKGKHYVCTQKVQVRAPGIRAELCWDSVGGDEMPLGSGKGNDIDLHVAELQGVTCPAYGWDQTCVATDPMGNSIGEDCYYGNTSPGWTYPNSPDSACSGWSSRGLPPCTNPRLDQDNISCDKTVDDPTNTAEFCAPENVNLDNPKDGERFVVGVNDFGNHGGTFDAHCHVNLYCNGARVLSVGINPVTGQTMPVLNNPGLDLYGDIWTVGTITAHVTGGTLTSCDVVTTPSHHADQVRDGVTNPKTAGNQLCVDSTRSNANPAFNYKNHKFIENVPLQGGVAGHIPATAPAFCKH
jgi:hypothetical protein